MPRKTRAKVIAELAAKGVEFDENANYEDLCKLLKEAPVSESRTNLPAALIEWAKQIGFTEEQIATYTDPEKLRMACNRIKPRATPEPEVKARQIYKPFKDEPKGELVQAVFTSEITTIRAEHLVRAGYDDGNLGVFCRKEKIRPETIQRVIVVRNYIPNERGILTTTFIIEYLKKG